MFDLDGFNLYNDRFGHMAGDTLLTLLGHRLQLAVSGAGVAYRPGGDEFCGSARQQTHDVLLGVLREREPNLHEHLREVGRLARIVGCTLGMNDEELDELHRAAELHDIGKAAVPDTILNKPGPLEEQEWAFMRRHTLIGERILLAAPALAPAAGTVRSSHERWDGTGYPDGLQGAEIPLPARIVAVCDAFDAITSDRPYAPARTRSQAIEELRAQSGTQFDPDVVQAFLTALEQTPPARLQVVRSAARG